MGKRRHKALYFSEDRHIRLLTLAIEVSYLINDKSEQGWHLLHDYLLPFTPANSLVALVSDRTDVPLSPFKSLSPKETEKVHNIDAIAHENLQQRRNNSASQGKKNYNAQIIQIAIIGSVLAFVIVAIMAMYSKGGGFHMPWS